MGDFSRQHSCNCSHSATLQKQMLAEWHRNENFFSRNSWAVNLELELQIMKTILDSDQAGFKAALDRAWKAFRHEMV